MTLSPDTGGWAAAGLGDGALLALAGIGAWRADLAKGAVAWSSFARALHEVEAGYLPALGTALEFYPYPGRAVLEQALGRAAAEGTSFDLELPFVTARGRALTVRVRGGPAGPGLLHGVIEDITDLIERRAQAEALAEAARRAEAEALLRAVIDRLPSALYVCDEEERIILWNEAYTAMFPTLAPVLRAGTTIEGLIRAGVATNAYAEAVGPETPEPERERWIMNLVRCIRSAGPDSPGREIPLPGGRWAQAREQRTPSGHIVSLRTDITALKQAMRDVEAAAEAKSMFLARMSHELRTPLNAILGFAQLLLAEGGWAPAQREQLGLLHDAGTHLRDLVNSLLDLAKINSGKLELEAAPMALGPLLEGCAGLLGPEARRKEIALEFEAAPGLPAAVEADATRLRQMVLNLLSNAVKFTPRGGRVLLRARPGAAEAIRIEVQDSGPGVPEAERPRLFQDFTQLGRPGDPDQAGTGLGLAITARLAELMRGRAGVESAPGQGATFWVELPLRPASLSPPGGLSALAAAPLPRLRLLVADDIAPNRILMRAMLGAAGHDVTIVQDGSEAVAQVAAGTFDAVLMDVRMPVMDGLEATRRIRALPAPKGRVPVIAVTASALAEEVAACHAAGMDAHLAKPVDREALFALLRRLAAPSLAPLPPGPASSELTSPAPGLGLIEQLGPEGQGVAWEFAAELSAVAEALHGAEVADDPKALRNLLHRGLGAAGALGAEALHAAIEQAAETFRRDGDAAAVLEPLRDKLRNELPALLLALEDALGAPAPG